MIKINLLSIRREKKKAQLIKHLELSGILFLVVLLAIGYVWYQTNEQLNVLSAEVKEAQMEKVRLEKIIKQVQRLEKKREFVLQRLGIIAQLKREQAGPVRFLDQLSLNVPGKMWFTSVSEKDFVYSVKGLAFSNQDIADFMKSMEKTGAFDKIDLVCIQQSTVEKEKVMDFTITLAAK